MTYMQRNIRTTVYIMTSFMKQLLLLATTIFHSLYVDDLTTAINAAVLVNSSVYNNYNVKTLRC